MRKTWLMAAFVFLLAMDVRAVVELWMWFSVHRHSEAVERLSAGRTLYWMIGGLVILFDLSVLWLTIRVGRRLRSPDEPALSN